MATDTIVAGLDIGGKSIKCVIATIGSDGAITVQGISTVPAAGLVEGFAPDEAALTASIREAVFRAGEMSDYTIKEVYLSVSGMHLGSMPSSGVVRLNRGRVNRPDVQGVMDVAATQRLGPDEVVLQAIPRYFVVDSIEFSTPPLGMEGVRLEVDAHLIYGRIVPIRKLAECCLRAGVRVVDVVPAPLAQAECLLDERSRDVGVTLVDIGAETTEIAVYYRGTPVFTGCTGVGSEMISREISRQLMIPRAEAENIKIQHGCAMTESIDADETIEVPGIAARPAQRYSRLEICGIIEDEMCKIFAQIGHAFRESELYEWTRAGGVVISGQGGLMPRIAELATRELGLTAQTAVPTSDKHNYELAKSARYSTALGLVMWACNQRSAHWFSKWRPNNGSSRLWSLFGLRTSL